LATKKSWRAMESTIINHSLGMTNDHDITKKWFGLTIINSL
jgi:hypothetical protein